jgi:acylphosphatase
VGFRYFADRAADELGVSGYVRNLADGRVEVYAIGPPDQLDRLSAMLAQGPRWADVTGVDSREEAIESQVRGFSVR